MAAERKYEEAQGFDAQRQEWIEIMRQVNAQIGIVGPPTMTAEELQVRQIASGIRPEDCEASRDLMRMRYGDDWEKDEEG